MLQVQDLVINRHDTPCFAPLGFQVHPGTLVWIQGPNGAGKSSLLKALAGFLTPTQGQICWEPMPPAIAYIGHLYGLHPDSTVYEELVFLYQLGGYVPPQAVLQHDLQALGLWTHRHRLTRTLSEGQKRKLGLLKLWRTQAPVWILDEPWVSLDTASREWLHDRICTHLEGGGLVLCTTHHEPPIPPKFPRLAINLQPPGENTPADKASKLDPYRPSPTASPP